MSVYRRGKRWWVNVERGGDRVQVAGGDSLADARHFEGHLRILMRSRADGTQPPADVLAWLAALPPKQAERLARAGLTSTPDRRGADVGELIDQWRRSLVADNRSSAHVTKHVGRVSAMLDYVGEDRVADIDPLSIREWLAEQREKDGNLVKEGGRMFRFGLATSNHYIRAIKQFCTWCVDHGVIDASPVATLKMMNAKPDVRKQRRAITGADMAKLVKAVEPTGKGKGKLDGRARALVYRLAFATALRAKEIRTLTAGAIRNGFEIAAKYAKARRRRQVYCADPSVLAAVEEFIQGLDDDELPFPLPKAAGAMFVRDAKMAGIYRDGDDFHTLRHSAGTAAAQTLPVPDLMAFMGVTSPAVAIGYTHSNSRERIEAALSQTRGNA